MVHFDPDEFIELLVKYHDGEANKKETRYVEHQLKENARARSLWEDVLITFADEDKQHGHTPVKRMKRPLPYWLAAAAAVLLVIVLDSIYLRLHKRQQAVHDTHKKAVILQLADGRSIQLSDEPADSLRPVSLPDIRVEEQYARQANTLIVPRGFTYAVKLADSTTVYINAATRLKFPLVFKDSRREVEVEGEAYFEVAPDPARSFVVHTGHADVVALGTSFNVTTYDNQFSTALLTGAVVVLEKNRMIQLSPGQAAFKDQESGQLVMDNIINDTVPGWVNGRYVFSKKTLKEVCSTIERLYDVEIIFDRPEIAQQKYNGAVYRHEPVEIFLDNVAKTLRVKWTWDEEKRVHLK
ncbi:FecR domain-containing protein [uncultured Chitinophaga sp.]|jgi:Fe2+-dicitrate sensor, membrane component|uniref:FecR family protein n=1 Tax=uncultured Chitinophaga sp. TaxID=339340 RepID=UPI0026100746|nr:FecR domain-containing protein [uncultured Chitinophaga sp.]